MKNNFLNFGSFLHCNENDEIKKSSLFTSTGWFRQFNGVIAHLVPFQATHDRPSLIAGNGT